MEQDTMVDGQEGRAVAQHAPTAAAVPVIPMTLRECVTAFFEIAGQVVPGPNGTQRTVPGLLDAEGLASEVSWTAVTIPLRRFKAALQPHAQDFLDGQAAALKKARARATQRNGLAELLGRVVVAAQMQDTAPELAVERLLEDEEYRAGLVTDLERVIVDGVDADEGLAEELKELGEMVVEIPGKPLNPTSFRKAGVAMGRLDRLGPLVSL